MQFVVFHGGWLPARREGPRQPATPTGIDTFLAALDRHGVPPNDNVWVDLGTVWRQVLTDPDQAAHVLGKLLSRVGTHRVLWGTDAIWYGSPQPQIMALRAFQISAAYQERYGYPALTDAIKHQIFGLNAAGALRRRPGGDPLRRHFRPAHLQPARGPPTPSRRRSPLAVVTERADHPAPDPGLARLAHHALAAHVGRPFCADTLAGGSP